jgi:hypothetical protein
MKPRVILSGSLLLGALCGTAGPASAADLSGQWEMVLSSNGQISARLDLAQSGDHVTGTAHYPNGPARVDGRVSGSEAALYLIFESADTLTQWYPRKVAEQAVGLTALWKLALTPGGSEWSGPFQGMSLNWNGSEQIISRYDVKGPNTAPAPSPTERNLRRVGAAPVNAGVPEAGDRILIEAENESESSIRPLSERPAPNTKEINPAWRPPCSGSGDWSLVVGGEFLKYRFTVRAAATYRLWVRDYVDRFQPKGVRRIIVEFDGRPYGVFPEVDLPAPGDKGAFGWHRIGGGVSLTAGEHTLKVTKEATTAGAAILDAFYR